MSDLPEMTMAIVTCRRPWYSLLTLGAMLNNLKYDGPRRWLISDGGSTEEEIDQLRHILRGQPHDVVRTDNLADMLNAVAHNAGEVWFVTLDDFMPHRLIDLTPDVRMLLQYPDVGAVRMGRLAFWGLPPYQTVIKADMIEQGGLHWWRVDKAQTNDPYICSIGTTVYHRRFWDAYGDIPACPPDLPGEGELNGAARYNEKEGPTVAIPVRFGEDCAQSKEPIWHMGLWRTDQYAKAGNKRL